MTIKEIFENHKNIAVYGMSANPQKPAYTVPEFLASKGYEILPINPTANEILGKKVYKTLAEVDEEIDILEVFRPSQETVQVVKEAIERKKNRGDIKVIWLQQDIYNDEAKSLAEANGFEFVQDKCMYVEYLRNKS
jgi:hypothetical protein